MNRLEELIQDSRSLSPRTKVAYLDAVRSFIAFAGTADWKPQTVENWVKSLQDSRAPQSINTFLSGLRWASRRRAVMDEASDFARPIEAFPVTAKINPNRSLTEDEVQRLLATVAGDSWAELRDRSIILLGLRAALRRHEIAQARWSLLRMDRFTFRGKGGREETVLLDQHVLATLADWRRLCPKGDICFMKQHRFTAATKPLSHDGIYKIIEARAAQAKIEDVSPHTLRHTCATLLEKAGVPPHLIQVHMRHRGFSRVGSQTLNPTTAGYVHVDHAISDALKIGE